MSNNRKVAFHTLGCKLNFSETSAIARMFEEQGYQKVNFDEAADIYVINTCSVTQNADKECKSIVKSALNIVPDAYVAIIGCYAQLKPEEIAKIDGVDIVLGATEKFKLLQYVNSLEKNTETEIHACEVEQADFFVDAYSLGDRTRVFLKVQDGCDYNCSFCTIPLARGKSRSDTIKNVLKNAREIATKGIKEIVLTGVNLGDFGKGIHGNRNHNETFYDLLVALEEVENIERYRISSIEPNLLTNQIIEHTSKSNKIVPHFHIPLQSGSDKILRGMRRRYLSQLYIDRVENIKNLMPHCCIGVDVITGFPGETEEEFLTTYNFLNQLDISYLHVFTYSERDNTLAVEMGDSVPYSERKKRTKMLRTLSQKKLRYFYQQFEGKEAEVLFEKEKKEEMMTGYTRNYIKCVFPYNEDLVNKTVRVKLSNINEKGLMEIEKIITIEEKTTSEKLIIENQI
jgi:threonylcarbamoyladenosine tRNA methylthiotransferase MtaB